LVYIDRMKKRPYPEDVRSDFIRELDRRREHAAAKARRFDRVVLEVKAEALDREQRVERARRQAKSPGSSRYGIEMPNSFCERLRF
jgi:hypothetical protein